MSIETTQSVSSSGVKRVANSVDDMMSPGIGPEQARVKINSLSYCSFDYNGKYANDPFISARALCSPTDGSNDNKDFVVDWTTGAKLSEFAIIDDGGNLSPTGAKISLTNTSNFALFQRSLKDAGYDTSQLNGDKGVRFLDGAELLLRRIAQPKRDGIKQDEAAHAGGQAPRENSYYTCLKIESLPGESKKAGAKKSTAPASTAKATPPATAPAKAATASNGNGSGSADISSAIQKILDDSGGSISFKDLKMSLFRYFKDAGKSAAECQKLASESGTEDFLITTAMEHGLSWACENDTLSVVQ